MATSKQQDETHTEISLDVLREYEGRRAINKLTAKLCNAMRNPKMRDKLSGHMQALLYDPTTMIEERELERPPLAGL